MPSTTFLEEEDKELVQAVRQHVDQGAQRIPWKDIAMKMKRWARSPKELAQRFNSLKRTFGSELTKFPRCFYTPVRASRGRRSDHILLIRQHRGSGRSVNGTAQGSNKQAHGNVFYKQSGRVFSGSMEIGFVSSTSESTLTTTVECSGSTTSGFGQASSTNTMSPMDVTPKRTLEAPDPIPAEPAKPAILAKEGGARPLIQGYKVPCCVHQAVITIFENISRSEVVYPPGAAHLNAGEILPSGVSAMISSIQQIGAIGTSDVFLDIGSGIGNVVVQFVLSTAVRASIGIEIRRDLASRCNAILMKHAASWPRLENTEIYAENVQQIDLSTMPPFSSATIVFANNLRFDPSVINYIADELSHMPAVRIAALTSVICPRHNSICKKKFCIRWELNTCVPVAVSWSSKVVPIFIFTARKA